MKFLLILPFLIFTAYFFYSNPDIDRGEHGSLFYTVTKCLPILALSLAAMFGFRQPPKPFRSGWPFLDDMVNFRHPAGLAFFLSMIGDWLLANRSNSLWDFTLGVIPFAAGHFLNTKFYSRNLAFAQRFWGPAVVYLAAHSVLLGLITFNDIFSRTGIVFQIVTAPYAVLLAWTVCRAISNWYYDPNRDRDRTTFLYMLGYVSFMFSDSTLMFDEFGYPFHKSQVFVLITYYAAQGLIFLSFAMHDAKSKSR